MQRLRDGDEADGFICQLAPLGGRGAKFNLRIRRCPCDLFRTRIRGDYSVKALSQIERRLTVSAGAVPDERVSRHQCGEVVEQRSRIMRAEIRVAVRAPGKWS